MTSWRRLRAARLLTRARAVTIACGAVAAAALTGCDPASVYGPLAGQWTARPNVYPIAAKPAVGGGSVYVGSWDGNEYSFNETSGALRWRSYLGVAQGNCDGASWTLGVTSSPQVLGGIAYLGGGGSTWDALDTASGRVLWTLGTGDSSTAGGHYNWSSPAVYDGHAYIGIASLCDSPLVQGELLRVNLATHQIENVFKVVPDGQVGGSIWTNPVIDASTNTVFVATGNPGGPGEPYAQSLVALDAATLAVKSHWSLPASDPTVDADFGTSPVLFGDSRGRSLVAVTNKNGMLYAFQRSDVGAGPVWQARIAESTNVCDMCAGSFSTGLFDGARLYYAAGETTIGGQSAAGSIRAVDPATGAFLWQHSLPAQVYGALAGANGTVVVPSSDGGVYVVRTSDGTVLYANGLTGASGASAIDGAPTIADGNLFIGTTDGVVHAFRFPAAAPASRPQLRAAGVRDANCVARRGAVLTADCRVAVRVRAQCARLGELPAAVGGVALDRLAVRAKRLGAGSPATVRVYANGSCAGRAAIRVRLDRHARARLTRSLTLPPGTVLSVAASRPLRLELTGAGRQLRAAAAPPLLFP